MAYVSEHRSQLLVSYLVFAMGLPTLTVFVGGLYRVIRRAEPEDGWLAMAAVASAVGAAGIFGAGTASFMVVAYRPATDPAVVRAFWDAGWLAYNIAGFGFVAWMVIVIVATLHHDALPRWSAWVGIPLAAINVVGPFAVQAGTGAFFTPGVVRDRRRTHLRRLAARRHHRGRAPSAASNHDCVTSGSSQHGRPQGPARPEFADETEAQDPMQCTWQTPSEAMAHGWHIRRRPRRSELMRRFENLQVRRPMPSTRVSSRPQFFPSQAENASSILVTRSTGTGRSEALFGGLRSAGFVVSRPLCHIRATPFGRVIVA